MKLQKIVRDLVCNVWKHLHFRDTKKLYMGFWEWSCSREDFLRHSLTALLGGSELRTLTPNLFHSSLCSSACPDLLFLSKVVLNTASPTIWGSPQIVSLEERIVKVKSSMVASITLKSPIYHGNGDAYVTSQLFDRE